MPRIDYSTVRYIDPWPYYLRGFVWGLFVGTILTSLVATMLVGTLR